MMSGVIEMDRLEADFIVIDLILHGSPVKYVLSRIVGIDVEGGD